MSGNALDLNTLDLNALFDRLRRGDETALGEIMAALYAELHALAARRMRHETGRHTLQPTALVNEAYLRLMHGPRDIHDRHHFFALAAQAMRRVLVDHARQKRADKRGGDWDQVTLQLVPGVGSIDINLLALDEALTELATVDPRAVRVVELRFFGGHTDKEVSEILDLSFASVRRDWKAARAWLKIHLTPVHPA